MDEKVLEKNKAICSWKSNRFAKAGKLPKAAMFSDVRAFMSLTFIPIAAPHIDGEDSAETVS